MTVISFGISLRVLEQLSVFIMLQELDSYQFVSLELGRDQAHTVSFVFMLGKCSEPALVEKSLTIINILVSLQNFPLE